MTPEETIIHNEKVRFKLLIEMLDRACGIQFETEIGKELHEDLCVAIKEVIKPIIKRRANDLVS
jgi:hypothetical protein